MTATSFFEIPAQHAEAKTLRGMRAAADAFMGYDTPRVLPLLDKFHKAAPGRAGMLIGFPLRTLLLALLWAALLAIIALICYVELLVCQMLGLPLPLVLGVTALLALWLIPFNEKARDRLRLRIGASDARLPAVAQAALWVARFAAQASMVAGFLVAAAGLAIPITLAALWGVRIINALPPQQVGPIPWLQQAFGLDPMVTVGPTAAFIFIGLLVVALAWKGRMLLAGALWAGGLYLLYEMFFTGYSPDYLRLGVAAAPAFLWPAQLPYLASKLLGGVYTRWTRQVETLVEGWDLRNSLNASFAAHRKRNQARVDKDGSRAVCKRDLAFFEQNRAGPVTYWVCPKCREDDAIYPRVRLVRGVIDTAMTVDYAQDGTILLINLRAWQGPRGPLPAPQMQEVWFACVGDPHEPELFIAQYHQVQAERNYESLRNVRAIIAADSNLDQNSRRQIEGQMRLN